MKDSEQSKYNWPNGDSEVPLKAATRLHLNAFDFTDLWDDEDPELDSVEEEKSKPSFSGISSPPPPPPLDSLIFADSPKRAAAKRATLKLHWRAIHNVAALPRRTHFGTQTIWTTMEPVQLDTARLALLFEWKANRAGTSVFCGQRKQSSVSVLGMKRSNNITITLSGLPPTHLLPPAIYSMDSSVLDREDIQRLQMLLPTEEELSLIKEAKTQNPNSYLAPAELCLLVLGEIPHLSTRLHLWAFVLDYDSLEQEIAKPLFYLKQAMEQLAGSQTFKHVLATVLAIGNFLNGCKARGFELSYLGKLSQVRDTRSRQPLLHHVCVLLQQLYPQSSDLYSDLMTVSKAGKCEYSLVRADLDHLQALSKGSWEEMKILDQADEWQCVNGKKKQPAREGTSAGLRHRLPDLLTECEERTEALTAVYRRVINSNGTRNQTRGKA
ncbi:FH1/FH2 domain-containing protein 1-like isoform X2 [Corythoichthys intestinalis]|uniref:FH1/FH2 domain-containing protein 1-like isoform X2 n=1 Tax=Corythoichthys intestinalis TaxID=161448 RepID=UPI0025A56504|nr:FH1/FH2 domain-containing protein 1-like isoform X2 [Corythoichthys intestinalis]